MKKILVLFLVIVLIFSLTIFPYCYADGLTMSIIGGTSFALMSDWGVNFTALNATGAGMRSFMESAIEGYINHRGGSLEDLFGRETARIVAGKLIVPYQLYNGIVNFYDYLKEKFEGTNLSDGSIADITTGEIIESDGTTPDNIGCVFSEVRTIKVNPGAVNKDGYAYVRMYYNGEIVRSQDPGSYDRIFTGFWRIIKKPEIGQNAFGLEAQVWRAYQSEPYWGVTYNFNANPDNVLEWDIDSAITPTVLNPDKEWSGTIGGQDWPDTNLDDLIGSIYDDVSLDDLEVEGEIVDPVVPPTPVPTPVPADTPLSDVPWGDFDDTIGSDIGDIADQTGDIADSIEDVAEDVQTLTDTITDALDIPTDVEAESAKFDLRNLFPFCIPFDIYRFLQMFDADPLAPHVRIPFVIDSLDFEYMIDLDFSGWSPLAAILRTAELIAYGIGLAWATSKVIKW